MNERLFKGLRTKNGAFVTYKDTPLDLRLDLKNHSPMGFEWGYNGSGPKQLALAILAQLCNDDFALGAYVEFSKSSIETIDSDEWKLDGMVVRRWISTYGLTNLQPKLTSGFKLIDNDNSKYAIYLDNNLLGRKLDVDKDCNTGFHDNKFYVYASFEEISHLKIHQLPEKLFFDCVGPFADGLDDNRINDIFYWYKLVNHDGILRIDFSLMLSIEDYDGYKNSKVVVKEFLNTLERTLTGVIIYDNIIEDGHHVANFSLNIKDETNTLEIVIKNAINLVVSVYDDVFDNVIEHSSLFEAIFKFPKEYQSILKPYMLYFEEFLNDLCIESDVSIRKDGLETILSVEPKDKDEALEKIANALKMYLSAPILATDVSIQQKLQMQVALQKLHAECSHLESQLLLKSVILQEQYKQLTVQEEVINETKRILVEAGVKPQIITENNIMLLNSLKEIRLDNKNIKKKTFFDSFKVSFKVPELFETKIEVSKKQLDEKNENI